MPLTRGVQTFSVPAVANARIYRELVGARIRRARGRKGLNQTQLAQMLGVPDAYVSRWETGKHMPEPEHLHALEDVFGEVLVLCRDNDEPEPRAA